MVIVEELQEELKVVLTQSGRNSQHQNWRRFSSDIYFTLTSQGNFRSGSTPRAELQNSAPYISTFSFLEPIPRYSKILTEMPARWWCAVEPVMLRSTADGRGSGTVRQVHQLKMTDFRGCDRYPHKVCSSSRTIAVVSTLNMEISFLN